jgi:hypothetical protein
MTTLVTRLADRLLSAMAPEVQAQAAACWYTGSRCVRCATTRARLYDYYSCTDGSRPIVDFGCGSC